MNDFNSLGLSENLLKVLDQMGFKEPTPIQSQAIPHLLQAEEEDFIGLAQTGTGKTAAFGLPLIELVNSESNAVQALILAPTRELGQQTAKQIVAFSEHYKDLNVEVVYGGAAISNQIRALKRPTQIVVATPGRLIDLIGRKAIRLDQVKYVVLDEADEMLNMGFKEDIDNILSNIKVPHVTWLFSATMPKEIRKIVSKYMNSPKEVAVNKKESTNMDIDHQVVYCKAQHKLTALKRFLDYDPNLRGIMFCRTKRETQEITDQLTDEGYEVEALHGDLSQAQRDAAMRRFKAKDMQLLIATDVAARGIDVSNLTHVFHHKLPDMIEGYTHRSGRTGRAGKKGLSIAFTNPSDTRGIRSIEKALKIKFTEAEIPTSDDVKNQRLSNWMKRILSTPIHPNAQDALAVVKGHFDGQDKESILLHLISQELVGWDKMDETDLTKANQGSSRGDRGERGEGRERSSSRPGGNTRYFINIGREDGLTERELHEFLSDVGAIQSKHFSDFSLQDKRAFFNLKTDQSKGFQDRFEGLELENGHAIKVKEEFDRNKEPRGRSRQGRGGNSRGRGRGRDGGNRSGAPRKPRHKRRGNR